MNYKPEQLTTAARHRADISVHRIIGVHPEAGEIEIEVNEKLWRGGSLKVTVSDIDNYQVGDFVDFQITVSKTSLQYKIIGHTPPKFAPENGGKCGK